MASCVFVLSNQIFYAKPGIVSFSNVPKYSPPFYGMFRSFKNLNKK